MGQGPQNPYPLFRNPILIKKKALNNLFFFKATNSYLISDFVEIQRKSFFQLLENGLIEEFSKRNPITNKNLEIFNFFAGILGNFA